MSLSDCEDLGGEASDSLGFCPTGYAVPYDAVDGPKDTSFGFVCGCVWGDDSSWKIEYLDLSKAEKGIVKRDSWMGYLEMPGSSEDLHRLIDVYCDLEEPEYNEISVAHIERFNPNTKQSYSKSERTQVRKEWSKLYDKEEEMKKKYETSLVGRIKNLFK